MDVTQNVQHLLGAGFVLPINVNTDFHQLQINDPIHGERKELLIRLVEIETGNIRTGRFLEALQQPWIINILFPI